MKHSNGSMTHDSSIVDDTAVFGKDTNIWQWCHVDRHAVIGNNCTLGQNVYVGPYVVIGNNVKIQNNVSVYEGVYIEDDVFLGPSCVFTNVKFPRAYRKTKSYSNITVKKGASIGANATILTGVTIGEHAFVAAGAVVTKDVPARYIVAGNPARMINVLDENDRKVLK